MKQKSIYERYTLKQQIEISRRAETMRTLSSELEKSKELVNQLTEIAKQTEIKTGQTNAMSLRSSSWYSTIVQEQLETTQNRSKFLQQEVDDTRKTIAKAVHKKNKSEEAWHRHEAVELANREEKFDQELVGRKRNISKFG
ncbi:MAG: hypothetical protein HOJ97_01865 [Alphaproteobacteria bacterium]|nr:hypothetical protein [Alphaproteobacteria bacterium]